MQSNNGYTKINGVAIGQSSLIILINNSQVYGYTDIEFKRIQDKDNLYAAGDLPWKRGYGNITFEGSITLYQNEIHTLSKAVIGLGYDNGALYNAPPFTLQIIVKPFAGQEAPSVTTLEYVEFKEDGITVTQGDKGLKYQCSLTIGNVVGPQPF